MSQGTVFFFFSSRRRHTRSLRDWSSDVCSSDLGGTPRSGRRYFHYRGGKYSGAPVPRPASLAALFSSFRVIRSDFQRYGTLAVPFAELVFWTYSSRRSVTAQSIRGIAARTGIY